MSGIILKGNHGNHRCVVHYEWWFCDRPENISEQWFLTPFSDAPVFRNPKSRRLSLPVLALKREVRPVGALIFLVPVVLLYLLVVSSIASAQDRDTRALPSANALFREFENDPINAIDRYVGKAVTLEGARGQIILGSDGTSAAVHIPDRDKPNALILSFPDRNELAGVKKGQAFRFTCTVKKFEYGHIWLDDCAITNSAGGEAPRVLSANALYRAFEEDEIDANNRYVGKVVTLEGLRGDMIPLDDGKSAALHIPDRGMPNALVLHFPDRNELSEVKKGQRFAFLCRVEQFEYLKLWLEDCHLGR